MNGLMTSNQYSSQQRVGGGGGGAPQSDPYYGASINSPAHYNNGHLGGQPAPQSVPYVGGYVNNGVVNDGGRGGGGRDREYEDEQRRRQRSHRSGTSQSSSGRQRGVGAGGGGAPVEYPPNSSDQQQQASSLAQFNYPAGLTNNVTPPSTDAASSSNLAQSSTLDATQRRPAYLLHRDLVIGKGSYGQVCIASRGEAEGHHSNKSGKRKKFACKCVMLRNDPKYIAKLQEEVNVLRELRGHDNVIRLFDVFCVDNELFIITELGRGGDLFHLLTTHPKHGVTEAYAGESRLAWFIGLLNPITIRLELNSFLLTDVPHNFFIVLPPTTNS